jgi:hypothetical protein
MTAPWLLSFRWDGDSFVPLRPKAADAVFVVGQIYWLEEAPLERSASSHRHMFAWLKTAHEHLPETISDLYPTPEHLRKRALIDAGWYRETAIDAGSKAAALRVAAYARGEDEFALVTVRGSTVLVKKARSQAMRGADPMNAKEFQASKTAIMDTIAGMIGVTPDDIGRAA